MHKKRLKKIKGFVVLLLTLIAVGCGDKPKKPDNTKPKKPIAAHKPSVLEETDGGQEVFDQEPVVELDGTLPIQGRVVYRVAQSPETLNSATANSNLDRKLCRFHLNFKMLERHPLELDAIPWLAATMPEKSADGKSHIWTIKEEATWADGEPVTGEDAAFTWAFINSKNDKIRNACGTLRSLLSQVSSVTAVDKKRFEVKYSTPVHKGEIYFGLNFAPIPKHLVEQNQEEAASKRFLPGSGPYVVNSWKNGVIDLERLDTWWGDKVDTFKNRFTIKHFVYKIIPDTVQTVEQLKSGAVDFAAVNIEAYTSLMKDAKKFNLEGTHYYLPLWSFIGFNCANPVLQDSRVRRALSLLIRRNGINKKFYQGLARPVAGPFFASSIFNNARIKADRYDPLKAKALLEAAGWTDRNGDGILDNAQGEKLSFVLNRTNAGLSWSKGIIESITDSWRQAGIDVTIETLGGRVLYSIYDKAQHEAYAEVWEIDAINPELGIRAMFHGDQCGNGGYNWQQYRVPKLNLLIEKFVATENDVVRIRTAHKIHAMIREHAPVAFLFNNPTCIVWNKRLRGVKAYPLGIRQWDFKVSK